MALFQVGANTFIESMLNLLENNLKTKDQSQSDILSQEINI